MSGVTAVLRFTLARPDPDPVTHSEVVRAALEMAKWGDAHGVAVVSLDEHHVTGYSWSSNPILGGGCMLAATSNIFVNVMCALGPLWNPIRMAEDIAFVDQMSGGRLITTIGLGYRPAEYAAMGVDFGQRGRLMDEFLETLLQAWSGEAFERNGEMVRVSPTPLTKPHPMVSVGGSSRATARRAVRFRLPLNIPDHLPELAEYYRQLCAEEGIKPRVQMASPADMPSVFLHEDPERAWVELGQHFLWEAVHYGAWKTDDMHSLMHVPGATTVEEVRSSGRYVILSPDELFARIEAREQPVFVTLHPLCGAMPVDEAWRSLHLLTDQVLPKVRE